MKKHKHQLLVLGITSVLVMNLFGTSVLAVTENEEVSSSSIEKNQSSENEKGKTQNEVTNSSIQAVENFTVSSNTNEIKQEEVSVNPFEGNIYFPSEPSEQDIIDGSILPGEVPLAEQQRTFENRGTSYSFSPYLSSNNSQIIKYPHAKIVTNYKPQFPKFGYSEGVGRPRGVVIHETANPNSTIWSEIEYMSKNYNNAFVQAFADANNIIEIHPTDYAAWGCGPNGNPYFVQIELVEHGNKTDFYKSVNNQAYYAAHILKRYNLSPSRASGTKGNPQGSIWGHFEVSSLLGGTNHSDPVGYFGKYGYSFNEFYELVQYHYNTLSYTIITKENNVNYQGRIIQTEDIFSKPKTTIEAVKTGSTASFINKYVSITKEATTNDGQKYYFSKELGGWVSASTVDLFDTIEYSKEVHISGAILSADVAGHHGVFNGIYKTASDVQMIGFAKNYAGKAVTIKKEAKTVRATWYYFAVDGVDIGWMDSRAFTIYDPILSQKEVNSDGKLLSASKIQTHDIYSEVYKTGPNSKFIGKAGVYGGQIVKIIQEATTFRTKWYQISVGGKTVGWIDSRAFEIYDPILTQKSIEIAGKLLPTNKIQTHDVYSEIYRSSPHSVFIGKAGVYGGQVVKIIQEATTFRTKWYQISVNGKVIGWIDNRAFEVYDPILTQKTIDMDGKLLPADKISTHDVYSEIYKTSPNSKYLGKAGVYSGKIVTVIQEATTFRAKWYQISVTGKTIGWIDSRAFEVYDPVLTQKKLDIAGKLLPASKIPAHDVYSEIYKTSPNSKYLVKAGAYGGQVVTIIQEATTFRAKWYQISVNEKIIGWIDSRAFEMYDPILTQKKVDISGQILPENVIVAHDIYSEIYKTSPNSKYLGKAGVYGGRTVKIIQEATTFRAKWYQFSINDKLIGWLDSRAFYDEKATFVYDTIQYVKEATKGKDLFPSVMMAQAILESGYGQSKLALSPNNNLFGVKGAYNGSSVNIETKEYDSAEQKWITVVEEFKKYPTKKESFVDNANKILNGTSWDKSYYRGSWKSVAKNYKNATKALTGKYATDPAYDTKLNNIINQWDLTQFD